MKDNDIIKALEVCAESDSCIHRTNCPYYTSSGKCVNNLTRDALALIIRQRVQLGLVEQRIRAAEAAKRVNVREIRAEAISEFSKRLKKAAFVCREPLGYAKGICTTAVAVENINRIEKEMIKERDNGRYEQKSCCNKR